MKYYIFEDFHSRSSSDNSNARVRPGDGTTVEGPAGRVTPGDGTVVEPTDPNEGGFHSRDNRDLLGDDSSNHNGLSGGNIHGYDYDNYYTNLPRGINGIAINYEKPENYNLIKSYQDAKKTFV